MTTQLISREELINRINDFWENNDWNHQSIPDTCNEIRDYIILSLPSIPAPSQWIPVEERLPEDGEIVITYNSIWVFSMEHFQDWKWTLYKTSHLPITHWQPLPPPPTL